MILLVSLCKEPLSEFEFVNPIKKIVGKCKVVHFTNIKKEHLQKADKIILTGTALKDFEYLNHDFSLIKEFEKPILGICAGMQVIAKAFNVSLEDKTFIGVHEVRVIKQNMLEQNNFSAYFLHTKTATTFFNILAEVNNTPCMIKHPTKEIYGCIFHPEVLNQNIIKNFINKTKTSI